MNFSLKLNSIKGYEKFRGVSLSLFCIHWSLLWFHLIRAAWLPEVHPHLSSSLRKETILESTLKNNFPLYWSTSAPTPLVNVARIGNIIAKEIRLYMTWQANVCLIVSNVTVWKSLPKKRIVRINRRHKRLTKTHHASLSVSPCFHGGHLKIMKDGKACWQKWKV